MWDDDSLVQHFFLLTTTALFGMTEPTHSIIASFISLTHLLALRAAALRIRLRPRGGGTLPSGHSADPRRPHPLLPLAPGALHVVLGHF